MGTSVILHDFAAKRLDEPLHNVSIKHGEQITEGAGGRLNLTENGSPRLRLFFSADPPDQTSELRVGLIVPEHAYVTVTAETSCGLKLTASRLFREEPVRHLPGVSETLFLPNEVVLASKTTPSEKGGLEGIIPTFPEDVFNSDYFVKDECPMFGDTVHKSWLRLDFDDILLGLRKDESKTCWVKLWSKPSGDPGLETLGTGFLRALSFLLGRRLGWQAYSYSIGDEERTTLRRQIKVKKGHFPPLPELPELASRELIHKQAELLQKATLFFQDAANEPVVTALQVCWDSVNNTFVTRGLLMCAALEGLADHLVDESPLSTALAAEKEAFAKLKKRVLQVLADDKALSGNPSLKGIIDRISPFGYLTSPEKLRKAGQLVGFTITDEEVVAWRKLRNKPAHGDFDFDFADPSKIQLAFARSASVANMLNKFVLALIGYKGPFRDYGAPGHPWRHFPE